MSEYSEEDYDLETPEGRIGLLWAKHGDHYLTFDTVENKRSQCYDLHAMIRLDELVPSTHDMIAAAEHDQVWIGVNVEDLDKVITDEIAIELISSGLLWDDDAGSFYFNA